MEISQGPSTSAANKKVEDHFKILIASDIHLGYCDNNPDRENDSFITFEEILQIGQDEKVDFVLLAGDLFHENKPKPSTLRRAMELLRKYCLGSKPVEFEYLGDPARDFPNQDEPEINYLNPNINIALPVFTIHGNHDDPIGTKKTSAVDHLVAAKLVNHFGQWDSLNRVEISPVPLVKGDTKIALYGLGNIKDERLYRLFRDQKITFNQISETKEDWFNIFVLHQNRAKHGLTNYIPEKFIPEFFELAIWGHEHECRIEPEPSTSGAKTYIIQPGSPVATSLCLGESVEKFAGILHVNKKTFKLEKRKLKTVRPFIFGDVMSKDAVPIGTKDIPKALEAYVDARVNSMLREALDKLSGHDKQPSQPLIRLRVYHERAEDAFNPVRFAQKFSGQIINDDIVFFKLLLSIRKGEGEIDVEHMNEMIRGNKDDLDSHVEKIVEEFFNKAREDEDHTALLEVLSARGLSEAVKAAVEKDDKDALSVMIENQMEKVIKYLIRKEVTEDNIEEELEEFRKTRAADNQESTEAMELLRNRQPRQRQKTFDEEGSEDEEEANGREGSDDDTSMIDDDDEEIVVAPAKGKRGKGRGARGGGQAATTRGRGRGKAKAKTTDDDDTSPPPARERGRGRGASRGGKGRASANTSLVQTTLPMVPVRRSSPRKNQSAMQFDNDSD